MNNDRKVPNLLCAYFEEGVISDFVRPIWDISQESGGGMIPCVAIWQAV